MTVQQRRFIERAPHTLDASRATPSRMWATTPVQSSHGASPAEPDVPRIGARVAELRTVEGGRLFWRMTR